MGMSVRRKEMEKRMRKIWNNKKLENTDQPKKTKKLFGKKNDTKKAKTEVKGLKQKEISEKLSISVKTIKNQIWMSLQKLKECLEMKEV